MIATTSSIVAAFDTYVIKVYNPELLFDLTGHVPVCKIHYPGPLLFFLVPRQVSVSLLNTNSSIAGSHLGCDPKRHTLLWAPFISFSDNSDLVNST